jgi:hypothetical protein
MSRSSRRSVRRLAASGGLVLLFVLGIGGAVANPGGGRSAAAPCNRGHPCTTSTSPTTTTAPTTTTTAGVYPVPATINDTCATDDTQALLAWIATVPDSSTLQFGTGKCYRVEGTLEVDYRKGLVFDGGGSTFQSFNAMTSGNYADGQRAMWRMLLSTGFVFRNMTIHGAYTHGGTHDATIQWAHAFDLRGSSADIGPVTILDMAGDCVFFGLEWSKNTGRSSGSFHDSSCTSIGRNAVSVVGGNDIAVQHLTTNLVGLITFDVEPDLPNEGGGPGSGSARVKFDSNTIGSYYLYAYAIIESAPNTDQSFTNNTVTGQLKVGVVDPANAGYRPQNVTVSGNTSTNEGAMDIRNVDGLTVTNNTVAPASISIVNCTNVVNSGNT